ncbi:hypothetical protein ACQEU3_47070 [Spirillospora sp. CA-253888]
MTAADFVRRARDRRKALGISQAAFADLMRRRGHTWRQTTVAKTEAAQRPLLYDEALAVADLLGIAVVGDRPSSEDVLRGEIARLRACITSAATVLAHADEQESK